MLKLVPAFAAATAGANASLRRVGAIAFRRRRQHDGSRKRFSLCHPEPFDTARPAVFALRAMPPTGKLLRQARRSFSEDWEERRSRASKGLERAQDMLVSASILLSKEV